MTTWELQELFLVADFKREGMFDMAQWKLFQNLFIKKFEAADADGDLKLKVSEVVQYFL
jgi:hypothetical protein